MKNIIFGIFISSLLLMAGCSKNSNEATPSSTQEQLQIDLKQANSAINSIVELHKNPSNGHTECYAYEQLYHNVDSLFSRHFYEYNHKIYSGHTSDEGNHEMNEHGDDNGDMCGIDRIVYQNNLNQNHDYHLTDSQMHQWMDNNNLLQYYQSEINPCLNAMQELRVNHSAMHQLHY